MSSWQFFAKNKGQSRRKKGYQKVKVAKGKIWLLDLNPTIDSITKIRVKWFPNLSAQSEEVRNRHMRSLPFL